MYIKFVNEYFRRDGCFHLKLVGGHVCPQTCVLFQLYLLIQ